MRSFAFLTLTFFAVVTIYSCKKTETPPKTKTQLLTSQTWVYDQYYTNYGTPNQVLAYKKGRAGNSIDLSSSKVKFNADGTYSETTQSGSFMAGTWSLQNNETQTVVVNNMGTYTSNIVTLSSTSYVWSAPSSGTYAEMVPQ